MPAREMFFTFDTNVKVNKETVLEFIEEYQYYIEEKFQDIKKAFGVGTINEDFLNDFITELKGFNSVNFERDARASDKQNIIKEFISDDLGNEEKEGCGLLKVRYLYDEWEYEGCGYDDHYYYTYTDDNEMINKVIKETEHQVEKLRSLGVEVDFSIKQ